MGAHREQRRADGEPRLERLREAAYEAELATGEREDTPEKARRHIIVRLAIIGVGSVVTVAGLLMLVLPGPGIVVVLAGLGILSQEVSWAERWLAYAKRKARIDKVREKPAWMQAAVAAVSVLAVAASGYYLLATAD